jgi:hypothetical protein
MSFIPAPPPPPPWDHFPFLKWELKWPTTKPNIVGPLVWSLRTLDRLFLSFFLSWKMGHQTITQVQSRVSHFFSPLSAKVDVQCGDQKTKKKTVFSLEKEKSQLKKDEGYFRGHILRHPKTKGSSNAHSKTWPIIPPLSYVVQLCQERFYCALHSRQQLGTSQK